MSLHQFLSILKVRWLSVTLWIVVAMAIAVAITSVMPRKYSATSQVVVDDKGTDPLGGYGIPPQLMAAYMATQVEVAASRPVALLVISELGLEQNPALQEEWLDATEGSGSMRDWLVVHLQRNLKVKPSGESSLLNITYSGEDPQLVARIANAFARSYLKVGVRMRSEMASDSRNFLDDQSEELRARLENAQARLTEYQKANQITSTDERLDVETARLQELSTRLTELQSAMVDAAKRRDMAQVSLRRGTLEDIPEVLQNPLIQTLKKDQSVLETRLQEQSSTLGESHPTLIKLRSELDAIRERIAQESANIVGSLAKQSAVLTRREAELRDALEKQRTKVLQVRQVRDELALLQRDVEDIQRSYAAVRSRREQTALESKATQAGAFVLAEAVPPLKPSSPNLAVNLAAALMLGGVGGVWSAVGMEFRHRRIRSAEDLSGSVDLPMIATIRRVPRRLLNAPARVPKDVDLIAIPGERALGHELPNVLEAPAAAPAAVSEGVGTAERAEGMAPSETGEVAVLERIRKPIGEILRDAGVLDDADIPKVLSLAAERKLRFGEAAIAAGLVKSIQVKQALAYQFDYSVVIPGRSAVSREVIAAYESSAVVADLRKLRTQVLARWVKPSSGGRGNARKALSVISPSRGDGKTFIASNLAVTFSQMGLRTLLMDGDLRTGRIHKLFGLDNRYGLSSVLMDGDATRAMRRVSGLRNLWIISAGGEAPNPSDLLSRERLELLLRSLEQVFDIIIIDTPNTAEDPDAEMISICAKGCILVGRANHTSYESIGALADEVAAMGVSIIGTTFVDA